MNPLSRRSWMGSLVKPAMGASLASNWRVDAGAEAPPATDAPGARRYGARGDGSAVDTAAVQAAIDACAAEQGGIVLIPAGDFLVGTLELKSHVTLHLAAKGRLLGSGDPAHYTAGTGVPKSNGNVVLLYAAGAENVAIEGRGTIDGNGAKFFRGTRAGPSRPSMPRRRPGRGTRWRSCACAGRVSTPSTAK